jgi:peroxiredoxin
MDNVNVLRTGFFALDFSLPDTQGDIFHLKNNLKDRFTCLCFFPNDGNEKINNFLKDLNAGLPDMPAGLPVKVIGICPEKISRLQGLKDKLKLNFPVLADEKLVVATKYHVVNSYSARPSVYFSIFIIDDTGQIWYRQSEVPGLAKYNPENLRLEIAKLI